MTAVFNSPDRGDGIADGKTSDTPQFDLKALFSEVSATTRGGGNSNRETDQIDFGPSDIYSRNSSNQNGGDLSFEQQGAMQIARHFSSFDDNTRNTNEMSFDREDAGRMVELVGDYYYAQNAIEEEDKAGAKNWLKEMRRDLADFTRGLFSDSEESGEGHGHHDRGGEPADRGPGEDSSGEQNENCGEDECRPEQGSDEHGGEENSASEEGSENGTETGSETGSEHGSEQGSEGEISSDNPVESGSEGFTPHDSMALLMNDMQELSQALASGDTEAAQQVLARMNRHLTTLLRQLGQNNNEKGQPEDDPLGTDGFLRTGPVDRSGPISGDGDGFNPLNPGSILRGLPNPSDILRTLPQPPTPSDMLSGLPQPPHPGDLLRALPQPPDPQDLLRNLPQPPNPQDVLRNIPKPPSPQELLNPGHLLNSLPSPGDLFGW